VNAADIVIDAVRRVEFGSLTTFRNLSVLGLSAAGDPDPDYLTLDEALAERSVHVVEVSEAGQIPELKIVNEGELPVLLLDGEELLGARQNRVINLTMLAPAHQTRVVPVSCVESGRWHHVSRGFAAAPRAQFAEGRAAKNAAGDELDDDNRQPNIGSGRRLEPDCRQIRPPRRRVRHLGHVSHV
jgi:hypothetical protein